MRRLPTICRFFVVCLGFFGAAIPSWSVEPARSGPDATEVKALAAGLIAAPDDAARDKLLAAAPPALAASQEFRREFHKQYGAIIYAGDYDRARVMVRYARGLAEKNGDQIGIAIEEWGMANIEGSCGDNRAALPRFAECVRIFEAAGDKLRLAGALGGKAIVHLQLGEFRQAQDCAGRSELLARELDNKEFILTNLNTQGSISMDQGMYDLALSKWQQTLALAGDDESWQVYLLHNIATVYVHQDNTARAAEMMERSAALAEKQGDKPRFAADLMEIGHLRWTAGRTEEAEKLYRRSLAIAEEIGDKRRITSDLSALTGLLWERASKKGQPATPEILGMIDRGISIARETGEPAHVWKAGNLLGKIRFASGNIAGARLAYEEAIVAIEDARGNLTSDDSSSSVFFSDKVEPYTGMVALLLHEKRSLEALVMAERAKARSLLDMLAGSRGHTGEETISAPERAGMTRLGGDVASLNRQIAAARAAESPAGATKIGELESALTNARAARDSAEQALFASHPSLRNRQALRTSDLSSDALRELLGSDGAAALLEYVVAADKTFLFLVAPGSSPETVPEIQGFILPLGQTDLKSQVDNFRQALADRSLGWQTGAQNLGDDLLGPVRAACAKARRLVIVPDGPLWELPFQAIAADAPENGRSIRTLWDQWPVSFAPSLTFLAQDRKLIAGNPNPGNGMRLVACGNPSLGRAGNGNGAGPGSALMGSEYVPLPDAERQVRMIAGLYGEEHSTMLVGADAHEQEFKRIAGDFDIIHFATHGTFNDEAPMYSRLLMSQADLGPEDDGLLEAWEWMGLKLHARLAILSACETGRGKIGAGEGVLGTSWALFGAGCPAVVVSQWKVDSASNTDMMIGFHRRLLAGEDPSEALRGAGLELAKDPRYRHPFYWAPFVFLGAGEPFAKAVARQ